MIKKEIGEESSSEPTVLQIKKEVGDSSEPASQQQPVTVNESLCWYDLEPEDTDDELEISGGGALFGPPNIMSRPSSPAVDIVQPIPVRPRPGQSITLSDLDGLRLVDKENTNTVDGSRKEEGKRTKAEQREQGLLSLSGSLGVTPSPLKERNHNSLTQVS